MWDETSHVYEVASIKLCMVLRMYVILVTLLSTTGALLARKALLVFICIVFSVWCTAGAAVATLKYKSVAAFFLQLSMLLPPIGWAALQGSISHISRGLLVPARFIVVLLPTSTSVALRAAGVPCLGTTASLVLNIALAAAPCTKESADSAAIWAPHLRLIVAAGAALFCGWLASGAKDADTQPRSKNPLSQDFLDRVKVALNDMAERRITVMQDLQGLCLLCKHGSGTKLPGPVIMQIAGFLDHERQTFYPAAN